MRRNLFIALSAAVLLHCIIALILNYFFRGHVELVEPVFKKGDSSLELTIEQIQILDSPSEPEPEPQPPEPDPEPELESQPIIDPEPQQDESSLEPEPEKTEPPKPEPEPRKDNNADLLEKGVQASDVSPTADIRARYPLGSRLRGEEGLVDVSVTLGASGRAVTVKVRKSSGFSSLDKAAVRAMREARFKSPSGGSTIGIEITKTFRFVLSE